MSLTERAFRSAVLTAIAAALVAAGCGGEPEVAPQPSPTDAGADAAPSPQATPTPAAGFSALAAAKPGPCDDVQTLALTTMFKSRAPSEAPGMQAEGGPVCGVVPEGQTLSSPTFTLQQGFCYTFLAQGLPLVSEVDMQLEMDLTGGAVPPALAAFNLKPVLAVDMDTGPQASVSAKQSCYAWAFPVPAAAKLVIRARTGTGPVAAQVYKKKK